MFNVFSNELSPTVHPHRDDAHYRRLIYTGCLGLLDARHTSLALKVWDAHFSGQRAFSAIRFARACRSALNLDTETTKALTHRLTELSYQPDADLREPVAAPPSRKTRAKSSAKNESKDGIATASVQIAFKVLLGELLNSAWRERDGIVAHTAKLTPSAKRMLLRWSAAPTPYLEVPQLSKHEMRKVIVCLHVWLSERYSHAYADLLFERALKNTERLGASFGFDVREI